MFIDFPCRCGKGLSVPRELAGQETECAYCGAAVQVPSKSLPIEKPLRIVGKERNTERSMYWLRIFALVIFTAGIGTVAFARMTCSSVRRSGRNAARERDANERREKFDADMEKRFAPKGPNGRPLDE